MSTSTPETPKLDNASRAKIVHNVALGAVIVCPIIMLIPPRKLDVYTLLLLSGTFIGANQISSEYTGTSILQRFGNRLESFSSTSLPPKAQETQRLLQQEKRRREAALANPPQLQPPISSTRITSPQETSAVLAELQRKQAEVAERSQDAKDEKEQSGLLTRIWMGGEDKDWKAKRDQKEKEALEEGKGYGDLIMEQIWEVWNWRQPKGEERSEESKGKGGEEGKK